MHPKLKFKISCTKDVNTFFCFVTDAKYDNGRSLKWAVLDMYPFFKKYKKDNTLVVSKAKVNEFVKNIYAKKRKLMKRNLAQYKENWSRVCGMEKKFYNLTDELFGLSKWPKGKYIAYPTVWGMYPKFLEDKTFQIPYEDKTSKYINVIIAHEMLHFKFYDYFLTKYKKYRKDKYDFFVWGISEIFNVIVQNSKKWLAVFEEKTLCYPEHEEIVKKLEQKYLKIQNIDVDELISDIVKLLNKSKLVQL